MAVARSQVNSKTAMNSKGDYSGIPTVTQGFEGASPQNPLQSAISEGHRGVVKPRKSKNLFGSSGRTRSLRSSSKLLKTHKLLNTYAEEFRRFRLFHISLGQFLGQRNFIPGAALTPPGVGDDGGPVTGRREVSHNPQAEAHGHAGNFPNEGLANGITASRMADPNLSFYF